MYYFQRSKWKTKKFQWALLHDLSRGKLSHIEPLAAADFSVVCLGVFNNIHFSSVPMGIVICGLLTEDDCGKACCSPFVCFWCWCCIDSWYVSHCPCTTSARPYVYHQKLWNNQLKNIENPHLQTNNTLWTWKVPAQRNRWQHTEEQRKHFQHWL